MGNGMIMIPLPQPPAMWWKAEKEQARKMHFMYQLRDATNFEMRGNYILIHKRAFRFSLSKYAWRWWKQQEWLGIQVNNTVNAEKGNKNVASNDFEYNGIEWTSYGWMDDEERTKRRSKMKTIQFRCISCWDSTLYLSRIKHRHLSHTLFRTSPSHE